MPENEPDEGAERSGAYAQGEEQMLECKRKPYQGAKAGVIVSASDPDSRASESVPLCRNLFSLSC